MDTNTLAKYLQHPDVQQQLLGSHHGPFSLGVTADPEDTNRPAIQLRLSGEDVGSVPKKITLDGEQVNVVVHPNFKSLEPY